MRNESLSIKDKIIDLIYNKKKSVSETAKELGTSESYVRKVKSENKINLSRSNSEDESSLNIPEKDSINGQKGQKKNTPPFDSQMQPAMRRALYRWLDATKPLTGFVKRTGVDGLIADAEYNIYLKLKDADRYDLQQNLLTSVGYFKDEIESIISSAPDHLLSNNSLIDHFQKRNKMIMEAKVEIALEKFIEEGESNLPLNYKRPICCLCKSNLLGILISEDVEEGKKIAEYLGNTYECISCKKRNRGRWQ